MIVETIKPLDPRISPGKALAQVRCPACKFGRGRCIENTPAAVLDLMQEKCERKNCENNTSN